jgi:hypothetical protein
MSFAPLFSGKTSYPWEITIDSGPVGVVVRVGGVVGASRFR